MESYFSGNTIQICPVGALTSAAYRFRSRPFDLISAPSIAEHDACGSAIRVDHRRGKVMRRLAGDDPDVNEEWITDKDRFAHRYGDGEDRLTRPLVRDGNVLRPASWPEAIDVAVRGLKAAGSSVGVLTGGRLTLEDAYGYSKFARAVLGTNNIDFRARQHSAEEADFLAHAVAGTGHDVSFADLENASAVLLVCLEPEEEAGMIFLRLRKAFRKKHLTSGPWRRIRAMGLERWAPISSPAFPATKPPSSIRSTPRAVRRASGSRSLLSTPLSDLGRGTGRGFLGTLSACRDSLSERAPGWPGCPAGPGIAVRLKLAACRLCCLAADRSPTPLPAWTPKRRGESILPSLEGRDADEIMIAASDGELAALVVAGVDPNDFVDPQAVLEGLEAIGFMVSLETHPPWSPNVPTWSSRSR